MKMSEMNFDMEVGVESNENQYNNWKGEYVGETLIGEYIGKKENIGQYNQEVYEILDDDGTVWDVFSNTVLKNKMAELSHGDVIKIVYEGVRTGQNGRDYKYYSVYKSSQTI